MAVLDIDGTLVGKNDYISPKTIETIRKMQDKGYIVTICTGRNIRKALPVAVKAGISCPISCIDGAVLYDATKNKIVSHLPISKDEVSMLLDMARNENVYIEINDGHTYFKHIKNKGLEQYDYLNKHTFFGRIKSFFGGVQYVNTFDDMYNVKEPYYQMVFGGDKETIEALAKKIKCMGMNDMDVRDFVWKEYIFINHAGISKTYGVKALCDYFDISLDEVVAIGDERNDLDMIENVGMGVAMGNAVESLKSVANYVTSKNTEDGVALALERFFF